MEKAGRLVVAAFVVASGLASLLWIPVSAVLPVSGTLSVTGSPPLTVLQALALGWLMVLVLQVGYILLVPWQAFVLWGQRLSIEDGE